MRKITGFRKVAVRERSWTDRSGPTLADSISVSWAITCEPGQSTWPLSWSDGCQGHASSQSTGWTLNRPASVSPAYPMALSVLLEEGPSTLCFSVDATCQGDVCFHPHLPTVTAMRSARYSELKQALGATRGPAEASPSNSRQSKRGLPPRLGC